MQSKRPEVPVETKTWTLEQIQKYLKEKYGDLEAPRAKKPMYPIIPRKPKQE